MNNYKFFPHTPDDINNMLKASGLHSLEELFAEIPEDIKLRGEYDIPHAMSEMEIRRHFRTLADENKPLVCFAGAGIYDHYTPSAVQSIVSRSEFLTSYTPYQAEVSQGTLHYIFEYQSMMTILTGMDISNASMYDGATATAEAALMAIAATKKTDTILVSDTVDPKVCRVVETYAHFHHINIETIPQSNGITSLDNLKERLKEGGVAGVIVQAPNYYGIIEDYSGFANAIHEAKALFIINGAAAPLALIKSPAEWGADIAVGDAQSLGIPMSFGGPGLGYMCCTEKLIRKMPGRIVGLTRDNRGQRAFVLTLQAREQHIRRQKATSNICSNQSLMALYATVYLSIMGRQGLKEAANASYAGAHHLCERMLSTGRFKLTFIQPFFNEFCVTCVESVDELLNRCALNGYHAGVKIDDRTLMLAVTEKRTPEEMDQLIDIMTNNKQERKEDIHE